MTAPRCPPNLIGAPANVDPVTGIATLVTNALTTNAAPGHTITAVYSGDTLFTAGNTGTPLQGVGTTTVTVTPIGTQVALAAGTPNPSNPGQTISFVATVSALAPSTADPTSGTVNFYDGSNPTPIGTATVGANHQADLMIGTLAGGHAHHHGGLPSQRSQLQRQRRFQQRQSGCPQKSRPSRSRHRRPRRFLVSR